MIEFFEDVGVGLGVIATILFTFGGIPYLLEKYTRFGYPIMILGLLLSFAYWIGKDIRKSGLK